MTQAMLLFRDDGMEWDRVNAGDGGRAFFDKFVAWAEDLERRGKLVAVDPLADGGRTVRKRGGALVVDGPFAEGREAVLGYFIVEVADLEEACALAVECPHSKDGGGATEVRMLRPFPKPARLTPTTAR